MLESVKVRQLNNGRGCGVVVIVNKCLDPREGNASSGLRLFIVRILLFINFCLSNRSVVVTIHTYIYTH